MRLVPPAARYVEELPVVGRLRIPPEWQDLNGHVSVRYYVELYDLGGWRMLELLGIGAGYFRVERRGFFDLEHHIWYLAEMHVGDEVSLHVRFVERSRKLFRGVVFIVNRTRAEVASAIEFLTAGADLDARATAAIPEEMAARLDRLIERHAALGWQPPSCGVIAV